MGGERSRRLFQTGDGRVRLGWRLALYGVLFLVLLVAGAVLLGAVGVRARGVAPLVAALAAGWVLLELDDRPPAALGFHRHPGAVREVLGGTALGAGVALAAVAAIAGLGGLAWRGQGGSPGALVGAGLGALWTFALPAAAEEALFRGYPFQAVAEAYGARFAVPAFSGVFGALHLANPGATWVGAVNTGLAGAFLSVLYLRTGSLWFVTGGHLGWNWAQGFLADLPVSGLDLVETPYIEAVPGGPAWLSGRSFGPEGSVVAGAALLLATWAAWRTPRLRPSPGLRGARPLVLVGRGAPGGGRPPGPAAGPGGEGGDGGGGDDGSTREVS